MILRLLKMYEEEERGGEEVMEKDILVGFGVVVLVCW